MSMTFFQDEDEKIPVLIYSSCVLFKAGLIQSSYQTLVDTE